MEVKFSLKSKETIRDLGSPEGNQICSWKLRGAGKMEVCKEQMGLRAPEPQLLRRLSQEFTASSGYTVKQTPTRLRSGEELVGWLRG